MFHVPFNLILNIKDRDVKSVLHFHCLNGGERYFRVGGRKSASGVTALLGHFFTFLSNYIVSVGVKKMQVSGSSV